MNKLALALSVLFVLLGSIAAPSRVFARDNEKLAKLKDAIVADCDNALLNFDSILEEDRGNLVSYLMEVLHLQLSGPNETISMVPPPVTGRSGMEGNPMARMDIWRSFDPDFELKAKSCALRILKKIGSESVDALGSLVGLARDRTLPDDFRAALEETTLGIADLVDQRYPSPAVISEVAGEVQPDVRNQTLARLVLERFGPKAVPTIFVVMIERKECARDKLRIVLRKLDPSYEQIPELMRTQLASTDALRRQAVIEAIPDFAGFYCGKISEVIALFDSNSDKALVEAALIKLNGRIEEGADGDTCQAKIIPKTGCDPKERAALGKLVAYTSQQSPLSTDYAGLMSSPAFGLCVGIEEIRTLAKDVRPQAQGEVVKVIAHQVELGRVGKNNDELSKLLLGAAISGDDSTRSLALTTLTAKNLKAKAAVLKAKKDPAFIKHQELLAHILVARGEGTKADKALAAKFVNG